MRVIGLTWKIISSWRGRPPYVGELVKYIRLVWTAKRVIPLRRARLRGPRDALKTCLIGRAIVLGTTGAM